MKILRTIESFYPYMSGPANQAFMISRKLKDKGIASPIFTTNFMAEKSPKTEEFDGIKVKRFNIRFRFMKYFYTPGMKKEILGLKPDIIHAHNYRSYQSELSFKTGKKLKIPFVINVHGSLIAYRTITSGFKKLPYKLYDIIGGKKVIDDADAVIVSSKQEYEEAIEYGVRKERLHIIPMGIDIEDYKSVKRTRDDDKLVLLFVGRICKDRNIMPILKALKRLDNIKIELRIVGGEVKRSATDMGGYLDILKDYAAINHLNAVFTGPKYNEELKKEYRNADIFVYTSLWENFGQTILEAAASGLPIISTPVGIANDIVINEKTGFIVDFHDDRNIADRINRLKDMKKRAEYGKNLQEKVKNDYNWKKITMQYVTLYSALVKNRP